MIDITLTTTSLTYDHWTYSTIFDVNLNDIGLPEEQMTLKISWASSDGDPDDDDDEPDGEAPEDEESGVPEVYTEEVSCCCPDGGYE